MLFIVIFAILSSTSSMVPIFVNGGTINAVSERRHSLGRSYGFDPRDGWEAVNITNLPYKYRTSDDPEPHSDGSNSAKRSTENPSSDSDQKGSSIINTLGKFFKGLKGIGDPEPVTITWYTGRDLLNPSCWANPVWAPTDASYACALTLDGWTTRPKCFTMLELCRSPDTCVFVRVVDTCAGCPRGTKHVDLTKAAFGQLADFDEGVLTVQMRPATEPVYWDEQLWGPKMP